MFIKASPLCREHKDVLQANGFDVREGQRGGALLTAVPFSKDTTFDASDLQELVQLLTQDGSAGVDGTRLPRPSRSESLPDPVRAPNSQFSMLRTYCT